MEEHGIVVQDKKRTVLIKAQRSTSCDSCASKKTCASGSADSEMLIEAENAVGAKVGDRVVFTIGTASILKAGLLLYLVPILCFIAGVVLGQTVAKNIFPAQNPDLVSGVLGVIFLALAFIGLKVYSSFIEKDKSFRPHVLRVE
ncbi:MAG: SoxR reducing system RseC family protein [Deltaproteobacteria bacterium]|nr:SoxR reducing system RseC family protein [Deltaproteobacteria bacterium]